MATAALPKPELQGIQTKPPMKITEPRRSRRVSPTGMRKGCLNLVLFYSNRAVREDSGWVAAGWIKESLMQALNDQPLLAGRLRKEGSEIMEIVSNDSGGRLLEATVAMGLEEFMEMEEEVRAAAEADLVFWKDIDQQSPHFSPLLYVQVTNFKCGGYSVGISCSLLLADLLIADNFLRKWGEIHKEMISTSSANLPIFYLPHMKPNGSFTLKAFSSTPTRGQAHTFILKITQPRDQLDREEAQLAELCMEEAHRRFGSEGKILSFRVVDLKEPPTVSEVKAWRPESEKKPPPGGGGITIGNATWKDLGIDEVSFYDGNKPAGVTCWVSWQNDYVLVMPIRDCGGFGGNSDVIVVVAVPGEEKSVNAIVF
ncbi:unnamed protein product [Linum tenue]|uniref:Uncharacterized protein n=1 Tax=Linum tenue TaxID=586396 RepID=A0AAV0Q2U2_9ROSI|nr:unnamed protein product [Linum tenue]